MKLIEPLASGIRGAENGSFQLYARGTTTAAGYYDSFEASGTFFGSGAGSLDSNGGAAVYVNQFVRVVVSDSDGVIVRDFVAGEQANATEAISQSFTGVDYQTAVSGTNKPVGLGAILDLWKTNSGSIDWKVLLEGTPYTLQAAFAAIPLYYNVKAYGAKGDGATDDTVAIQAAITAAVGAPAVGPYGGIVYFPHGTYKITNELTIGATNAVSFLGAGSGVSKIIQYTVGKKTLIFSGTTEQQFVQDLGFFVNGAVTAATLSVEGITELALLRCRIKTSSGDAVKIAAAGTNTSRVAASNCTFELGLTPAKAINNLNSVNAWVDVWNCKISAVSGYVASGDSWIASSRGTVLQSYFDITNLSGAGGFSAVECTSLAGVSQGRQLTVIGNQFVGTNAPGGSWYAMKEPSQGRVYEDGNSVQTIVYSSRMATESVVVPVSGGGGKLFGGHEGANQNTLVTTTTAATLAIGPFFQEFGVIIVATNTATQFSGATLSVGRKLRLIIKNNDVGAHTSTFDATTIFPLLAEASIAAGRYSVWMIEGIAKEDGSLSTVAYPLAQSVTL